MAEALDSVFASQSISLEVVVIDHGSIDSTSEILRAFSEKYARLKTLSVESARPFAHALEAGRARCTAPFIARFDADDLMHKGRLADDTRVLQQNPHLAAVSCQSELFGAETTLGMRMYVAWQNSVLHEDDFAKEIWIEQPHAHPSVTFRSDCLDAVGGYRAGDFPEDYDLFLRMHCMGFAIRKREALHHFWREREKRMTREDSRYSRDAFFALKARAMSEYFSLRGRKVWVMGPGKEGARITRALRACDVKVDAFFDVNQKRVGRERLGAKIYAQSEMRERFLNEPNAFAIGAVGTSGARGAVRTALSDAGFVEGKNAVVVA